MNEINKFSTFDKRHYICYEGRNYTSEVKRQRTTIELSLAGGTGGGSCPWKSGAILDTLFSRDLDSRPFPLSIFTRAPSSFNFPYREPMWRREMHPLCCDNTYHNTKFSVPSTQAYCLDKLSIFCPTLGP